MPVLAGVGAVMAGVVALTGVAMAEDAANEEFQEGLEAAHAEAKEARHWALEGVPPQGGEAVFENDPEFKRKALFEEHCATCHAVDDEGGEEAPVLTDYGSRAWLAALIRNPNDAAYFGGTDHDLMDPYPEEDLPAAQLDAVVEYLVSTMGEEIAPPADAALAAKGKTLWEDELECNSCHEIEPGESGDGPNLHGHGTRAFVEAVIKNSSADVLFGSDAQMPKFEDKLTPEEIAELASFVVSQRTPEADGSEPETAQAAPEAQ
jgi:mono/diheme cytochrome c family protein